MQFEAILPCKLTGPPNMVTSANLMRSHSVILQVTDKCL